VFQETKQRVNFFDGALPVFSGKRVHGEASDPYFAARLCDGSQGGGTVLMSSKPWQPALLSPTAITVHNDRDVLERRQVGAERFSDFRQFGALRSHTQPQQTIILSNFCILPITGG
jgi:hypothetical protein